MDYTELCGFEILYDPYWNRFEVWHECNGNAGEYVTVGHADTRREAEAVAAAHRRTHD